MKEYRVWMIDYFLFKTSFLTKKSGFFEWAKNTVWSGHKNNMLILRRYGVYKTNFLGYKIELYKGSEPWPI